MLFGFSNLLTLFGLLAPLVIVLSLHPTYDRNLWGELVAPCKEGDSRFQPMASSERSLFAGEISAAAETQTLLIPEWKLALKK